MTKINTPPLKAQLKVALAVAGIASISEFARLFGISNAAIHNMLAGKTTSQEIEKRVFGFIDKQWAKIELISPNKSHKRKAA